MNTPAHQHDKPLLAIALIVVAVGIWATHDAAAKWYAATYPVFVILFWRSLFGTLPVFALASRQGGLQRMSLRLHLLCILRGTFGFCAFSSFVFALPMMPLADAIAVGMSAPIFITAASAFVLKEHVGPHRWGAVLVGFAAVLFIVRPGGSIPWEGAALLLFSNTMFTTSMLMTRRLGRVLTTASLSIYTALAFAVLSAIAVIFVWVTPSWEDWLVLVLVGLMAGVAQYAMTAAFRIAPSSTLAPFEYTGVVWAVVLGFGIWGEWPSRDVWIGATVIVFSGLYIVYRERLAAQRRRTAAA
ncbi:MAG: DMT family transporter [Rhodospirillaceae bacterium]|nr:DMT family transporter [Rhodospirillaceae bacterium]